MMILIQSLDIDIGDVYSKSFQSIPESGTGRVAFTRFTSKKSRGLFQNRFSNWGGRKNEQEIGKLRYRTISFPCEQKNSEKNRSSFGPLSVLVWLLWVTPSQLLLSSQIHLLKC